MLRAVNTILCPFLGENFDLYARPGISPQVTTSHLSGSPPLLKMMKPKATLLTPH